MVLLIPTICGNKMHIYAYNSIRIWNMCTESKAITKATKSALYSETMFLTSVAAALCSIHTHTHRRRNTKWLLIQNGTNFQWKIVQIEKFDEARIVCVFIFVYLQLTFFFSFYTLYSHSLCARWIERESTNCVISLENTWCLKWPTQTYIK